MSTDFIITKDDRNKSGWVEGQYKGKYFNAKVYDEGSEYGIQEGRVSKLAVCSSSYWDHTKIVVEYDRGYPEEPSIKQQALAHAICAELAKLPVEA